MFSAIVLSSGGLDSLLVIKLMEKTQIPYKVVHFDMGLTHNKPIVAGLRISKYFGLDYLVKNSIEIDKIEVATEFYNSIISAHHHVVLKNICLDQKIFLLTKAHQYMLELGADFIVTGDVIDQRPLIQGKDNLLLSDREAGVEGIVFRPLSAQSLPFGIDLERYPQLKKIMYDFKGFTKEREVLAKELNLKEYPESKNNIDDYEINMGKKAFEVFEKDQVLNAAHIHRIGLHFRLSDTVRFVLGRTPFESTYLNKFYDKLSLKGLSFKVQKPRFLFGFLYGKDIEKKHEQFAIEIFSHYINPTVQETAIQMYDHEGLPLGEKMIAPMDKESFEPYIIHINTIFCPLRNLDQEQSP